MSEPETRAESITRLANDTGNAIAVAEGEAASILGKKRWAQFQGWAQHEDNPQLAAVMLPILLPRPLRDQNELVKRLALLSERFSKDRRTGTGLFAVAENVSADHFAELNGWRTRWNELAAAWRAAVPTSKALDVDDRAFGEGFAVIPSVYGAIPDGSSLAWGLVGAGLLFWFFRSRRAQS